MNLGKTGWALQMTRFGGPSAYFKTIFLKKLYLFFQKYSSLALFDINIIFKNFLAALCLVFYPIYFN